MTQHLTIGLFGYGVVGHGLYDILNRTQSIPAEVARICVKHRNKKRDLPEEFFTWDKEQLLRDDAINVIVEVIDDADEAYRIVKSAMNNGKHVISANKKMIAEHFAELVELQQKNKVSFLYEASACASIPIIRNLEEYYDNDLLAAFEGIFNGSSNHILTRMVEESKGYQEALRGAQELGFAESDPALDVGGHDSTYKLVILAAHAFGMIVRPEQVFTYGINTISDYDLQFAREKGLKIKLVANGKMINGGLATWVMPRFVDRSFRLFDVENENNGIVMEGAFSDAQHMIGKGAGSYPTGSAVISDISALTYGYKYEYKKYFRNRGLEKNDNVVLPVYIRYKDASVLERLRLESIDVRHQSNGLNYVIGTTSLNELMTNAAIRDKDVFLAQLPHANP